MSARSQDLATIVAEIGHAVEQIERAGIDSVVIELESARRVFLGGAGRSGFVARAFANRLMHLGLDVHVLGETTTPPVGAGDLLVVVSGSGRTTSLLTAAEKARELGAAVATITCNADGPIANAANGVAVLPSDTRLAHVREESGARSVQPVGSLFEQLAWLTCDAIVMALRERSGQSREDLLARHANIE